MWHDGIWWEFFDDHIVYRHWVEVDDTSKCIDWNVGDNEGYFWDVHAVASYVLWLVEDDNEPFLVLFVWVVVDVAGGALATDDDAVVVNSWVNCFVVVIVVVKWREGWWFVIKTLLTFPIPWYCIADVIVNYYYHIFVNAVLVSIFMTIDINFKLL